MNQHIKKIAAELEQHNIKYEEIDGTISVALPEAFGRMVISPNGDLDDTIYIEDCDFHTHGSVEAAEYETSYEKGIRKMIQAIFSGQLLLIEEFENDKPPKKLVRCSLESYLKYLPENVSYKIYNKI